MLTSSGNQYLRPEYLTPLPTTLDAKKSPLALLAQTCSQIGADTPNNKPIIPPIEKKKSETPKGKSSPSSAGSGEKSSFKHYDASKKDGDVGSTDERSGFKSPPSKGATPSSPPSVSPVISATGGSKSPSAQSSSESKSQESTSKITESTTVTTSVQSPLMASVSALSASKLNFASLLAPHELAVKDLPLGTFKPTIPGFGYPTCLSGYVPVDGVSTTPTLASSLATQSPLSQKPGLIPPSSLSALNPYVGYARIKTAAGTETLVPVCRDPYCTGCQLSIQNAHMLNGSCPNGCAQCDHQKNGLHSLALGLSSGNPLTSYSSHSVPGGPRPYVCNWIQGETYCGKRFSSSEELLQHLRTHTNLSSSDSSALSLLSPAVPTHPFLTTSGLHRTYPTPPLSPLSTGRYHPYSKVPLSGSLSTLSSSFTNSGIPVLPPHPLSAYYSPYALYGQRIGAAAGLHP